MSGGCRPKEGAPTDGQNQLVHFLLRLRRGIVFHRPPRPEYQPAGVAILSIRRRSHSGSGGGWSETAARTFSLLGLQYLALLANGPGTDESDVRAGSLVGIPSKRALGASTNDPRLPRFLRHPNRETIRSNLDPQPSFRVTRLDGWSAITSHLGTYDPLRTAAQGATRQCRPDSAVARSRAHRPNSRNHFPRPIPEADTIDTVMGLG